MSGSLECRFCGSALSEVFADLGMSPLSNAYLRPEQMLAPESFYPLTAYVCGECLLVQLPAVESPERIFSEYAYFSSYSSTWLAHAERFCADAISRFGFSAQTRVVEIASNDGYLLQYFAAATMQVLGIEPAANVAAVAEARGIPTIVKFFGSKAAEELVSAGYSADLLVANNVLAHVPDLNDFVAGMKILLAPAGVLTIEVPHVLRLMEGNQFDTIYHEHFSYFSFLVCHRVLSEHRLQVFDVQELPTHGGSLRLYVQHAGGRHPVDDRVASLLACERSFGLDRLPSYAAFKERVWETKHALLTFLIGHRRAGRTVVGYGAPAKGNTLLNYCGIRQDLIAYTVDRSPHKQGLFLPGTRLPIYPPEKLRQTRPDFVLVLPWNLQTEIMAENAYVHDWGGQFVVPIPSVHIVS